MNQYIKKEVEDQIFGKDFDEAVAYLDGEDIAWRRSVVDGEAKLLTQNYRGRNYCWI